MGKNKNPVDEVKLTVAEAATELRKKPVTIRLWVAQRKLASFKLGRHVLIPRSEIERVLAEGYTPAAAGEAR